MHRIILRHNRAPGDVLVMTALVRDLALSHPGKYQIMVDTSFRELWDNNPYVVPAKDNRLGAAVINLSYGKSIGRAGREPIHFLTGFHHDFLEKTKTDVPLLYPRPDLHLSREEDTVSPIDGRYWIVMAGGKNDFTTKHPRYQNIQESVDILRGCGLRFVQIGGKGSKPGHFHCKLNGVIDLVGQTSIREMIQLIRHADGVICTITFAMHIAAALEKPCVVTAGGREEWWWEAVSKMNPAFANVPNPVNVSHRYLHTMGTLPCCLRKACWKNKCHQGEGDKSYCSMPVKTPEGQIVPKCQEMITTERIVEAVLSYYAEGIIQDAGSKIKEV